ncbi:hypothetical protein ACTHGU_00615 [Chitinophagaceae bacterium MMS25-I14]
MPKYVVHKKGFFYTDEAFEAAAGAKGSVMGIYDNLDNALAEKGKQDMLSMQNLAGENAVDFFFYNEDYKNIFKQLEKYYKTGFGITIEDEHFFNFPEQISEQQAKDLLAILGVSFHDVVTYESPDVIAVDFDPEVDELGEF